MGTQPLKRPYLTAGLADGLANAEARILGAESVRALVSEIRLVARRLVGADGIAVVLREGTKCHYVEEDAIGPLWKGGRFPLDTCVSGWAMTHSRTAVIPDILKDARVPQDAYRPTFVRAMAMAPMGQDNPRGAIGAYWAEVHAPSEGEVATLERLAGLAGEALERLAQRNPASLAPPLARTQLRNRIKFLAMSALERLVPESTLPPLVGHALAVSLVAATYILRLVLVPLLGGIGTYTSFFPALLLATLWGGRGAALTALALSAVAAATIEYLAVDQTDLLRIVLGTLFYLLVGTIVAGLAASMRDALDRQKDRQEALEMRDEQLARISRELDHRSRNTLAVVAALTNHAARTSSTPAEMAERLNGHFTAMSETQTHLLGVGSDGMPARDLLHSSLRIFESDGRLRIDVEEDILAPPGCETMLCLAFHELATNSCKYGALAAEEGLVTVAARRQGNAIRLVWSESGGPKVTPPERRNSGARLIERALGNAPGGKVEIAYLPAGLVCTMTWQVGTSA